MEKRINPGALALVIELAIDPVKMKLKNAFEKFPEDPAGVLVSWGEVNAAADKLIVCLRALVEGVLGEKLPDVVDPSEPGNDFPYPGPVVPKKPVQKFNTKRVISNLRYEHGKPFTWLPETGAAYGGEIKFVWPECGVSLLVPDARDNYSPNGHGLPTYFCGTKNRREESNGNRASVFGPPGCHTTYVEIHYNAE